MKTVVRSRLGSVFISSALVLAWAGGSITTNADVAVFQPTVANHNYHDDYMSVEIANTPASGGSYAGIFHLGTYGAYDSHYAVQFNGLNAYIGGHDVVTSAVLSLFFYYPPQSDATTPNLDVYRLTQPWVNGATTWFSNSLTTAWTTPGGTVDPTPVAALTPAATPTDNQWFRWDVTSTVSNWVNGTLPSDGFLVKWDDSSVGGVWNKDFIFLYSGAATAVASWSGLEPMLTIYTVPEPSSLMLAGVGLAAAGLVRRALRRSR